MLPEKCSVGKRAALSKTWAIRMKVNRPEPLMLAGSSVVVNTDCSWACQMRGFLEWAKCRWHHLTAWDPGVNKQKASQALGFIGACPDHGHSNQHRLQASAPIPFLLGWPGESS